MDAGFEASLKELEAAWDAMPGGVAYSVGHHRARQHAGRAGAAAARVTSPLRSLPVRLRSLPSRRSA